MEGLSYLGDDEGVLDTFAQAKAAGMLRRPYVEPLIYHLAGVAAARLGQEREARRYFRQALRFQPSLSRAADNLADLRKPVGQRDGPWAFGLHEWVPPKTLEHMQVRDFAQRLARTSPGRQKHSTPSPTLC